MMNYPEFLFRKDDEVVCPSCKENVFVPEDVSFSKVEKLVKCGRCGAYVRWGKLQKDKTKTCSEWELEDENN